MSTVKEIQSVQNACRLLEVLAERQPLGVSELARAVGFDKSAAHRLAVTLHRVDWLDRTEDGRWRISPTLARIARHAGAASLVATMRPHMEQLRDETGETVMLVAIEDARLRVRAVVESHHTLRIAAPVGAELPLLHSSAARAIAAHLPPDELAALRSAHPNLDDDSALARIRRRGYAVNDREIVAEARVVGAPVLAANGHPLAALIVSGPASRVTRSRVASIGEALLRATTGAASLAPGASTVIK